ncbi:hypothetical protein QBC32DRAFT_111859 [Pseudoneurospora amorphoporcata]|uniref:Uncharacterized protein n=1 Tax=Pseudoneurospora amorphoporcata TaxID=241081 RepID=A0AAN6SAY3_9PEZI|nr:hypothetical protein QBC32DRAFT_111859 [Pseudoneurospora amorphoporcata]
MGNVRVTCRDLVEDYFQRDMTFEKDSLNAFSGILAYLESLEPPVYNIWGVLILPDVVVATSPGQRIRHGLASALAWSYNRKRFFFRDGHGKLEQPTILPRKGMFPSWTWADWRRWTALDGEDYIYGHTLELPYKRRSSAFTPLVDLSAELDDGSIVSLSRGDDSDISWLTKLHTYHPRILHIDGYTSNPQLRWMTAPPEQEDDENDRGSSEHYSRHCRYDAWVLIDSDGEHLQMPFGERTEWDDLSTDAYHFQRQRGYQTKTIKPQSESTFDLRIILLGHNPLYFYYMVLMKAPGTGGHTETFERVNVITEFQLRHFSQREKNLAHLTGKHANSFRGTPWVKMSTRVA